MKKNSDALNCSLAETAITTASHRGGGHKGVAVGHDIDPQATLRALLPGAKLTITALHNVPELRLWLIDPAGMHAPLSEQEVDAVFTTPPYWCFCWGSGKALAAYILREISASITGATVLDFGCGSGVAGIAAALAGARRVIACDSDPVALASAARNAELNGVELTYSADVFAVKERVDYLFAADVFYDRENFSLLQRFRQLARRVIIADSRVSDFAADGYTQFRRRWSVTQPDLGEPPQVAQVAFYGASGNL